MSVVYSHRLCVVSRHFAIVSSTLMAAIDFSFEQDLMDVMVSQATVKRLLDQVDAVDDDGQTALKRAKYTHVYLCAHS